MCHCVYGCVIYTGIYTVYIYTAAVYMYICVIYTGIYIIIYRYIQLNIYRYICIYMFLKPFQKNHRHAGGWEYGLAGSGKCRTYPPEFQRKFSENSNRHSSHQYYLPMSFLIYIFFFCKLLLIHTPSATHTATNQAKKNKINKKKKRFRLPLSLSRSLSLSGSRKKKKTTHNRNEDFSFFVFFKFFFFFYRRE